MWGVPRLPINRDEGFPDVASYVTQASVNCDFSSLNNRPGSSPSDYQNSESREKSGSKALLHGKLPVCGVDESRLFNYV